MPLDFAFSSDQVALRKQARALAKDHLSQVRGLTQHLPTARERFVASKPIYERVIAEGFLRRLIPAPFGGEGSGLVDMAVVAEEFHAEDVNVSLTLFANLLGLMPVFIGANDEQKERLIAPFLEASGAPLAALANSEPGGSANFDVDAEEGGTRTVATFEDGAYVIDGVKQWVSSATGWDGKGADLLSVVCRSDLTVPMPDALSILVVTGPIEGIETLRDAEMIGHRAHLCPRFRLNKVRVPAHNLIGPAGCARDIVAASFTGTAALVGVMGVAVMRAAFNATLAFAKRERRGGPHPIIEHQAVGYALADAKTRIEAARSLAWRACWAADAGHPGAEELALQSKVYGSETAVQVITDLIRIVGIDAYDREEQPLAGLLADALAFPLFDGGNMGVRRRQMHALLSGEAYDPLATIG
ncbi:MAG: acyl-CoA dehydrogenase family protein [Pseudomonadota bacterium]